MPSAANAKSEKPASSEASDNSPIRQIMTVLDHKIRNLEKRKSKLTSYRDLQKSGKELNSDQKVAVAKYDEVAQTLEFARELSKQVTGIATSAEREAKKQAKRETWIRYAADTNKIREVLLILDCLNQMGSSEARDDFLTGSNGAAKLTEEDLKILDDLYPEVTPKHEPNEEGQPGFHTHTIKAAEHLYAIIDGKPKEVLGTTYTHIKEIITTVHDCGYFDKTGDCDVLESEVALASQEEEQPPVPEEPPACEPAAYAPPPLAAPAPVPAPAPGPASAAPLPAPAYPLRPPMTLQEVEQAYFSQQYPQQRPISEVIGSQNFFFLQESEIDSPIGTPQPPMMTQPSPPGPIPTQTFTNQHFVRVPEPTGIPLPPQPHFPPHPEHAFAGVPLAAPMPLPHAAHAAPPLQPPQPPQPQPPLADRQATPSQHQPQPQPQMQSQPQPQPEAQKVSTPVTQANDDEWKEESRSPDRDDTSERKTQGQGDGQNRYRRYGGRGGGGGRGASNGYRGGRGAFQSRQGGDYHGGRHGGEYQNRSGKDGYQNKQYNDGYQNRHGKDGYDNRRGNDTYYGNGDAVEGHQNENGGRERERYGGDGAQGYAGFKSRGRGGARPAPRGGPHAPRARPHHYSRKPDNTE